MTESEIKEKEKCRLPQLTALATSLGFTALIFLVAIFLSDEISDYVRGGLRLAIEVIVPSVFPFLILTDICFGYIHFERVEEIRRIFERCFNINGAALPVFVCGLLCGFPVGARLAIRMCDNGKISKCECERLVAFANNASPGFVICAVGLGIRNSLSDGIFLYSSMLLSSIICGMLFGINKSKSNELDFNLRQKYSLTESVKSASVICLHVSAFVCVFSIIIGLAKRMIKNAIAETVIITLMEIGNASVYLSNSCILPPLISLMLTAFAISFSGLCVCAQTLSLIDKNSNISLEKYIPRKLIQGCIAALTTLVFSIIKGL